MTDCCEPGCTTEVLCPVHQALTNLRTKVEALRDEARYGMEEEAYNRVLALFDGGQS